MWFAIAGNSTMESSSDLKQNYDRIQQHIGSCLQQANRPSKEITILGASKQQSVEKIRHVHELGVHHFGENYLADALPKIQATQDLNITWHFIGTIQSNKTRGIATYFDWVHSVDRLRVAARLNATRSQVTDRPPLNVCVEVNVDNEPTKSGLPINAVESFILEFKHLHHLQLRGLMTIPRLKENPADIQNSFQQLRELFTMLKPQVSSNWDTLSMGMSADYGLAITEGATMIRLGTSLFGPRR